MKYAVPCNWDKKLVASLRAEHVSEVYGKLQTDFVGGLRTPYDLPRVSRAQAKKFIQLTHDRGIEFNYLLNSPCLDGAEFSRKTKIEIRKLLDWLSEVRVDSVTVIMPMMAQIIQRYYPHLKISVSLLACVDTPAKALLWEEFGARKINVYSMGVNHNFTVLEKIRQATTCALQLLGNNFCLSYCPYSLFHSLEESHCSQSKHFLKGFSVPYYLLSCMHEKLSDPSNFIRSGWILPEDVDLYEKIGIDSIKIEGRNMTSEAIAMILDAYISKNFEGNFFDLCTHKKHSLFFKKSTMARKVMYYLRPMQINIFKFKKLGLLLKDPCMSVDSSALRGVLDNLRTMDCRYVDCAHCCRCGALSKDVMKFDAGKLETARKEVKKALEGITRGSIFKYTYR